MNNETAVACKSARCGVSPQTDGTVQRSREEKPHPLLTYFVCGLMAVGRNGGRDGLEHAGILAP